MQDSFNQSFGGGGGGGGGAGGAGAESGRGGRAGDPCEGMWRF
ncbi:hypothetical protein HpHCM64_15120 [Helicobacter pylori]